MTAQPSQPIQPIWETTRFDIDLRQPVVMGIVNVTPDSFSDGGRLTSLAEAKQHCERLVAEGAGILDIGGESTRPGAEPVSVQQEMDRILPLLEFALKLGVAVSVDTRRAEVMRAALAAGADIINDVQALQGPGCLQALSAVPRAGICLMHMRGEPQTMQSQTDYVDVVLEVRDVLQERAHAAIDAGIARQRIVLDPGIGFSKTPEQNLDLLRRQHELQQTGFPLLVGWSRKSTLGVVTGRPVGERLAASLAAAIMAVERGARLIRVHDVAATVDAIKVWQACQGI